MIYCSRTATITCTGANAKGIHLKSPVGIHIFAKRNPPIKILGTALLLYVC